MKNLKLRYYLRGLGIGVLVSVLILTIADKDDAAMTDAQIRERAIELGMVDADSIVLSELKTLEPESPEESVQDSEVSEESEPGPTEESVPEEPESESEMSEEGTTDSESPSNEGGVEVLNITIGSGASSYTVSELLFDNHLVEDAAGFDQYLCDNGYSRSIRVGTHEIPTDATWEEIAKIITGKR